MPYVIQVRIQFMRALRLQSKIQKCKKALLTLHVYTLQGQKNIVFCQPGWEIFSSCASVGKEVLLFLTTVLFLVGRLHTRFCLNTFFEIFLIFLGFKLFSNLWINPYPMFFYTWYQGSLYLWWIKPTKIVHSFKILCRWLWMFLFLPFLVKFNYLEIYFISKPQNSKPMKKVRSYYFVTTKP